MQPVRLLKRGSVFALRWTARPRVQSQSLAPYLHVLNKNRLTEERGISTKTLVGGVTSQMEQVAHVLEKAAAPTITETKLKKDDWMLEVTWQDGSTSVFPYIWLRDNCQCPACFHPTAMHRKVTLQDLDINVTPISMQINNDTGSLEITWSDGHEGYVPSDWLHRRSFTEESRKRRQEFKRPSHTYWGSELRENLPQAKFEEIMEEDKSLLEFLMNLETYGLVIVKNTPCQVGQVRRLSERVGYLKRTHYGTTFSVKVKVDPNNLAYTSEFLNMHTDLPYLESRPGLQLLHCLEQTSSEGGDNHLVDSCHVAWKFRQSHPEKFELLSTIPVDFFDIGEEDGYPFNVVAQWPLIHVHKNGEIAGVSINQMARDSYFVAPVEKVRDWYDAMMTFYDFLYHPSNIITYKMEPGDILAFDNLRTLHGRAAYRMTEGTRELEGVYWDWDMVKSYRRVLQERLGLNF